jgi:predicted transcriptional regulator
MKRTTIVADDDLLRGMHHLAQRRGTTFTAVLQDAMRAYLDAQKPSTIEALAGIATSGKPVDYSDGRDEEILKAAVHPIYGLAPVPPEGWGD